MKRLTIALCLHGYFPDQFFGTAVYARQLAQALQRLGHRPVIVVPRFEPALSEPQTAAPEWLDGIEVRRILRPGMQDVRDVFDAPHLAPALQAIFQSIGADVVHIVHFLGLGTGIFTAAHALGIPVFATFTDFHGFCHRGTLLDSWGSACKGPKRRGTNCVACGLRDRADEQPKSLGLAYLASWFARPTSAVVLPLLIPALPAQAGRDLQAVLDRPAHLRSAMSGIRAAIAPTRFLRDAYRRNGFTMPIALEPFGIDADRSPRPRREAGPVRVGFIGQIGRHKGCHVLVDAVRHLRPGSARVRVWGDMTRHPRYADGLRRASKSHDISFEGSLPQEKLDEALRCLDVLVMPSLWAENAPLTLLQALACHTPCLVSDQPGMTEFVRDGVNGGVFPSGSAKGLAAIIQRLADDPDHLKRLSRSARYDRDSDDMAESTLSLYSEHGVG